MAVGLHGQTSANRVSIRRNVDNDRRPEFTQFKLSNTDSSIIAHRRYACLTREGAVTSFALTVGTDKMAADKGWKLTKIGHVMLGCTDMSRSLDFYNNLLGLDLKAKIPGFAFFDTGAVTLCLSEPLARFTEHLEGATEVVFPVDDIDDACERLRERGVEFIAGPRQATGTEWSAIFRDPDDHKLSIFGPKANPCAG